MSFKYGKHVDGLLQHLYPPGPLYKIVCIIWLCIKHRPGFDPNSNLYPSFPIKKTHIFFHFKGVE